MQRIFHILVLMFVAAALSASPHAQALAFEPVGDMPIDASDLAFDRVSALWATSSELLRLPPGGSVWEEVYDPVGAFRYVLPLGAADTILFSGHAIRRSVNGGQTFVEVYDEGEALYEAPSSGVLLAGTRGGSGVAYSSDRGATWHEGLIDAGTWSPWAEAFIELPPGHAQAGRFIAGCWAGLSYSDDGGQTWQKSSLWEDSGRYLVRSVAVGMDGRVYAAFFEVGVLGLQIAVSTDGGQTYAVAYQFGVLVGSVARIVALSGGANPEVGVLVAVEYGGKVRRSDDGAVSWRQVGQVPFEDGGHLEDAVVGPDSLLYVSGARPGGGEWVFRTTVPVVTAAAETEAEPVNPPIVIGPGGGAFAFTVRLTNQTTLPLSFEAWSAVAGPVSREPVLGPRSVTLPPGATVMRTLRQQVPGAAPSGTYTYAVRAGAFPGIVVSSDSFTVTKQGAAGVAGEGDDAGWAVSGWAAPAVSGEAGVLLAVSPNPARGAAEIRLDLSAAGAVSVEVYDVLGRHVAVLAEGPRDAGRHALVFDGSALPAGVYVVRAEAGGTVASRTVMLVR
jgi:hypothetical protein